MSYIQSSTPATRKQPLPKPPKADKHWPIDVDFWRNYEVVKELGSGFYGTTYLVTRLSDGTLFALKIYRRPANAVNTFIQPPENNVEVQVLKQLGAECPWFVKYEQSLTLLDPRDFQWKQAVLQEYMPGGSLEDRKENLTRSDLVNVARQLLTQLACMHGAGLLHRDIKPDNVLYDGQRAVLIDYGLVCRLQANAYDKVPDCQQETRGHAEYMAPESTTGQTEATDIWSLGVMLWYLLHPQRPDTAVPTSLEQVPSYAAQVAKSIAAHPSKDSFDRLLKRMTDIDPDRRPTALKALLE